MSGSTDLDDRPHGIRSGVLQAVQSRGAGHVVAWVVVAVLLVRATAVSSSWFISKIEAGNDPFLIGDWLINFEGGFVRRGIFGQVFETLHLGPLEATLVIQILVLFATFTLLICTLSLLWMADPVYPWLLVVLSPAFLLFPFLTFSGGFRKEILGLGSIALMAVAVRLNRRFALWLGYAAFIISMLVHESILVAIPTVMWLLLQARRQEVIGIGMLKLGLAFLAVPVLYTLSALIAGAGSSRKALAICSSLTDRGFSAHVCSGSIDFLSESFGEALARTVALAPASLSIPALGVLSLTPFIFVGFFPTYWRLIAIQLLALLPLFVVGMDYGRWVFIGVSALSLAALSVSQRLKPRGRPIIWVAFGLLMLFWSVPNEPTQFFLNPMRLAWWGLFQNGF